jgi:AAA family ATP:ADP antiporter
LKRGLRREGVLERFLSLFTEVRKGEGWTAILLMLNLFFLLTCYLILKTVREPLILAGGGAEIKSYAAAGQALLLVLVVPAYGFLASRVNRIKLITWVVLFFIFNLIAFYVMAQFQVPLGVAFFLWVGIFNLFIVAQFWSFANDIYTPEQGGRLFAIIAFGGSLGAILGPKIAGWLFKPLGAYALMLVAAALLGLYILIANIVNRLEQRSIKAPAKKEEAEAPLGKEGGFELVIGQRYLLLIALLMIALNLVNTTGEFILGKTVTLKAQQIASSQDLDVGRTAAAAELANKEKAKIVEGFIGEFYANFFFWVSLISAAVQLFLVSRILNYVGVSAALFFLPGVALGGYSLIVLMPVLSYITSAKIIENSIDYSLQNTCRQALFLPTSREAKYKAKAAIDTFFVRIGDVLSALFVFTGVILALDIETFAAVNVGFALASLCLVVGIARCYKKLSVESKTGACSTITYVAR